MKEMTPYNSFCVARRPLLPAGLSSSERNVQLGKMWNALSQAEKDQYKGAVAPMVAKVDPTPPPTQVGPSVPFVPQQQLAAPAGPISAVPLVPVGGGKVALPDSPVKLAAATTPLPLGHSHHAAPALPAVAAVVPMTSELHLQQQRQFVQQQQLQQQSPMKDQNAVLEGEHAMRHVSLTGGPLVAGSTSGAVAGSAASSTMALAAGHAPAQTAAPGGGKAGWVTSPCMLKEMI